MDKRTMVKENKRRKRGDGRTEHRSALVVIEENAPK